MAAAFKYGMFAKVLEFENSIAEFYGAPFCVTTDCCTHALELSLRYQQIKHTSCPSRTYISVPFTLIKLAIDWHFEDRPWRDYYYLGSTNIIDAGVYWKRSGYISESIMCLSFQFKKHLNLIRGGAILLDDGHAAATLRKMSIDGRDVGIPWTQQDISMVGYHYYMTPETAALGLEKLPQAMHTEPRRWSSEDYPDLRQMTVFRDRA